MTLTVAAYSAIIFAYGTIASGAWGHHPIAYLSIAVAFFPVGLLSILYGIWAATGKLEP